MAKNMKLNGNTIVWYPRNILKLITYISTLCWVLYNPTKT